MKESRRYIPLFIMTQVFIAGLISISGYKMLNRYFRVDKRVLECYTDSEKPSVRIMLGKHPCYYSYVTHQHTNCYYKEGRKWIICPIRHVNKQGTIFYKSNQIPVTLYGAAFAVYSRDSNNKKIYRGYTGISMAAISSANSNSKEEAMIINDFITNEKQRNLNCDKEAMMLLGSQMSCLSKTPYMTCKWTNISNKKPIFTTLSQ